jgi:hypothetical protein
MNSPGYRAAGDESPLDAMALHVRTLAGRSAEHKPNWVAWNTHLSRIPMVDRHFSLAARAGQADRDAKGFVTAG